MNVISSYYIRLVLVTAVFWFVACFVYYSMSMPATVTLIEQNPKYVSTMQKIKNLEHKLLQQKVEGSLLLALLKAATDTNTTDLVQPASAATRDADVLSQRVDQIPVVVMACNRAGAIKTHVDRLLKIRPFPVTFPIIVSQDCNHTATGIAIRSYGNRITYLQQPNLTEPVLSKKMKKMVGYYKIARHYRWTLDEVFVRMNYQVAIITEDDLLLASDFFEYFLATYKLLAVDATLLCVSAWNDNGKLNLTESKPDLLHRTDFFPGLGWMLTRELWQELRVKWPEGFWDDWLRNPEQRKGRACIRPELSRTGMSKAGKVGVSGGMFFDKHLQSIHLNDNYVRFTEMDLSHLLKDNYDKQFFQNVLSSPIAELSDVLNKITASPTVRVVYGDAKEFSTLAKQIGMMEDMKDGVPRTAYYGVVTVFVKNVRVYFVPLEFSTTA